MSPDPAIERAKVLEAIQRLFPGNANLRLRESIMVVHASFGELPFLSGAVMGAIASAARFRHGRPYDPEARDDKDRLLPNDFDEWTNYLYAELHDGMNWLLRVDRSLIELGIELHRLISARERKRRASEEEKEEKEYAQRDAAQYELQLRGGGATVASGPGSTSGSDSGHGTEGGAGESPESGRGGADPEGGTPGQLHSDGRPPSEGPVATATRILRT